MEDIWGTNEDIFMLTAVAVIVAILLVVLGIYFNVILPFIKDRQYVKMEMQRSYSEEEYRFWKRELRRVYIRHIPIIGRFFR